ncbi:CLUMA_CG009513, isoform A [Clunio marinus]|uniref:CLUMA_CG009513, isoform A n=1 Tax=Clunio marinus TaxID=568069 RepID=A0A1J1I723_9DIPT|nr:CLUMA_CG009513, isoform A [Clunio marinus]
MGDMNLSSEESLSGFCRMCPKDLQYDEKVFDSFPLQLHHRTTPDDDSPKYHSNVNFQPSKSDKSIDFDVLSAYISDSTHTNPTEIKCREKKIICRGFSISFNSIKPITNIHIYHKMVKDLFGKNKSCESGEGHIKIRFVSKECSKICKLILKSVINGYIVVIKSHFNKTPSQHYAESIKFFVSDNKWKASHDGGERSVKTSSPALSFHDAKQI